MYSRSFITLLRKLLLVLIIFLAHSNKASAQTNKIIDSLVTVLKTANEDTGKVKTLNSLSTQYRNVKNFTESRKSADEALELAEKLNFKPGVAAAYNNIALMYEFQEKSDKHTAIKYLLMELKILEELGDPVSISYTNVYIGEIYYSISNYPGARKHFLAALKISQEKGFRNRERLCYNYLGHQATVEGNYADGLRYYQLALKITEERKDTAWLPVHYSSIGEVYGYQGNYSEALKYHFAALKINETRWVAGTGTNHNQIGDIYLTQGRLSDALNHLTAALKIVEEHKYQWETASVKLSLGKVYKLQGNYTEALKHNSDALKIWKELGHRSGVADAYIEMGEIAMKQGHFSEAEKNHLASLEISKEIGYRQGSASSYINLGHTHIGLKNYPEARQHLLNGLSISKEIGFKELTKNAYEALSRLDSLSGNYLQALTYTRLASSYKDSLLNEANNKQVAQLREQYQSEIRDREILQLASEKQRLETNQQLTALLIKSKEDSLKFAKTENEKIRLEKERADALNLYNQQQLALLAKDKRLKELQIEKNEADLLVQVAETKKQQAESDKRQEQLLVLNKEKAIQNLALKKQTQAKNYLFAGLILLSVLSFLAYRYYLTRQKLKLQTLRNKIASDLHDDIGSTLSSISIFSQMAQDQSSEVKPLLHTIGESSRKMLDAMADIVWTINPENDQFEKIIMRMRSFAYELLGAKQIEFRFIADSNISAIKLSMEARRNLYLIFKEATNNMVKYADASRALFSIKGEQGKLVMMINDNGKGFDSNKETQGNGLKNMQKRASEMGAVLRIDSVPGNGTTIKLELAV